MDTSYKFITGNEEHNAAEAQRIVEQVESMHPSYSVTVTYEVDVIRTKLRFALKPQKEKNPSEGEQYEAYELTTVEVESNEDIDPAHITEPVSEAILDYELGDRL